MDVLSFAGICFCGQLSPNQFTGINIRATKKPEIISENLKIKNPCITDMQI